MDEHSLSGIAAPSDAQALDVWEDRMARCSDSSVMCPFPRNLTVPDASAG